MFCVTFDLCSWDSCIMQELTIFMDEETGSGEETQGDSGYVYI